MKLPAKPDFPLSQSVLGIRQALSESLAPSPGSLLALFSLCLIASPVWAAEVSSASVSYEPSLNADGPSLKTRSHPGAELGWQPFNSLSDEQKRILDASQAGMPVRGASCGGYYVHQQYAAPAWAGTTEITADQAEYTPDGGVLLQGNVSALSSDMQIQSDEASMNKDRTLMTARGQVRILQNSGLLLGDEGDFYPDEKRFEVTGAHYLLYQNNFRGDADKIRMVRDNVVEVENGSYTSCPPTDNSWQIVSGDIELDSDSGFGTATHARLKLGPVPVFYWPYLKFPIDDRRHTGLLWPEVSLDNEGLEEYRQPLYLNLAENYDATLTPHWFRDRGTLMNTEFRYLLSEQHTGQIQYSFLNRDSDFNNEDRDLLRTEAQGMIQPGWFYRLDYSKASDDDYFRSFESGFDDANTEKLTQLLETRYYAGPWSFRAALQGFQELNSALTDASREYNKLPELEANYNLSGSPAPGTTLSLGSNNRTVTFRRDIDDGSGSPGSIDNNGAITWGSELEAQRSYIEPYIGYRQDNISGFWSFNARVGVTDYKLNNQPDGVSDSKQRTIPVLTADSGLIFDRETQWFGQDYTQTLEPRLFWTWSPYEDQTDIPLFDTDEYRFDAHQLFRDTRFTGIDRQGDLHKVSLGVTSRFLNDQGRETLSLMAGQALYPEKRKVSVSSGPNASQEYQHTRDVSPLVTEARYSPFDWLTVSASYLFNTDRSTFGTERREERLYARHPSGVSLLLGHSKYYKECDINGSCTSGQDRYDETADLGFAAPLNDQWRMFIVGRRDLEEGRYMERIAGLEYESCCWMLRVSNHEYYSSDRYSDPDALEEKFLIQLVLKGFGAVGQGRAYQRAQEFIPGYSYRSW